MLNQNTLFSTAVLSPVKVLRDYQDSAIEAVFDYFAEKDGNPIVVMPTGAGKSVTLAEFIKRANELYPVTRFIVLSHVSILLKQNAEALLGQWPQADISFYSASLGHKDMSGDIIFAGIQSIYKKAYKLRKTYDICIVDECHTISPDDDTTYRKFLDDMKAINPNLKIVGFTASPFRSNSGYLHKAKNALFTDIAYEIPIVDLMNRGHLCHVATPQVNTQMDVTGVKRRGDDFILSQLSKAVDKEEITKNCVDELLVHGNDRGKWLVFGVDIPHAEHICEEIKSRGIACDVMHSKKGQQENNMAMDRFKNGQLRCLVNVAMLTTGVDVPSIDLISFMRPIRSPVLYLQCIGRGLRPYPGKTDCVLVDFGGCVSELGPIDQIRIKEKEDGTGEAPVKYCENCGACCPAGCALCPECGHPFPENGLNLDTKASDAAVLSSQSKPQIKKVSKVMYYRHKKEGKPDTLRVDYLCGFDTYREWMCFEHGGFPREKACKWWKDRTNKFQPPRDVGEALVLGGNLKIPSHIHVKKVGRYFEITDYNFNNQMEVL